MATTIYVQNNIMANRACDACHERRTKCVGRPICGSCQRSGLGCTFDKVPKKKGPKGKVIEKISALQKTLDLDQGIEPHVIARQLLLGPLVSASSPAGLADSIRHELASTLDVLHNTLSHNLNVYFSRIFPLSPILDKPSVIARFESDIHLHDKAFAALLLSACANALILPECSERHERRGCELIEMALRLHHNLSFGIQPTLETIATSMLMGGFLQATTGPAASYMKTREAIVLCEVMKLDKQETLNALGDAEREIALTILWKLAVAHRSTALLQIHQVSFGSRLHELSLTPKSNYTTRLVPITRLFCQLHPSLVDCINGVCSVSSLDRPHVPGHPAPGPCGFEQLQAVMTHHSIDEIVALPDLSPVQVADLLITKAWLKVKIWLVCISHGILQADEVWPELAVTYPIPVAFALQTEIERLDFEAIAANGRCISVKLGLVADAVEMVLRLPNPPLPAGVENWDDAQTILAGLRQLAARTSRRRWVRSELPG